MTPLENILRFVDLLNRYRNVERGVFVNKQNRLENDVEHSYQLAMLAWFLVDSEKLSLDSGLILKYALVHDLVEAYAGDTFAFANGDLKKEKIEKEHRARERLKKEFPELRELNKLISNYEAGKDPESRFIYALDKLQPTLNIYADGGRTWRKDKVTLQMIIDYKNEKISKIPELKGYFDELIQTLKQNEKKFFENQ